MSEVPGLKLIQAVDPTKIKVTINEKFSKLTLSSNKKKKLAEENLKSNDPKEIEKRRSASRNLMDELGDEDEDTNRNRNRSDAVCVNAILRSSSLSDEEEDSMQQTETQTQCCDVKVENISATADESMERLHMSEDLTQDPLISDDESELNELTQKVSGLTVSHIEKSANVSPTVIDIVSSSEDENVDEDEESVISISETSIESNEQDCLDDYNLMVMSDVQNSVNTGSPQLPCTLSNDRADRIEAFLRDVSQEKRNMWATGGLPDDTLLAHLATSNQQNINNDNKLMNSAKAKMIAIADTESMSTGDTELGLTEKQPNKKLYLSTQRNIALDDTEAMSESEQATLISQESSIPRKSNREIDEVENEVDKRLANDDTEANTTINSFEISHNNDINEIEDSVVISETSSDDVNSSHVTTEVTSTENHELVPSEDALSASLRKDSAQHSQIELSVCSINISAKINIKLQIQTEYSTSEEESDGKSSPDINEQSADDAKTVQGSDSSRLGDDAEDNDEVSEGIDDESRYSISNPQKQKAEEVQNVNVCNLTPEAAISNANEDFAENDPNFICHAQKILTELYGNSWQTPDVLRTLKRTSKDAKNKTGLNSRECSSKKSNHYELNTTVHQKGGEESVLADFSIFRQNIAQTNLDSTRMTTPKLSKQLFSNKVLTEPKIRSKKTNTDFKIPLTEKKKKTKNTVTRTGRPTTHRWRELIDDSDSDQNNITDDAEVDQTAMTDDNDEEISNASDSSWRKSAEESENEDYEIRKRNLTKTKITTKSKGNRKHSRKSKDRLIYLDLSKDEVTVLEGTPNNSPPANKDENFGDRLSQILSSCRFEDKPKVVATPTSTGKSKRRLFTVSYSDEIIDDSITAICRGETPKKKGSGLLDEENEENVRFNGVAIPPSFNIYNKALEAVKTGKPIIKKTPTSVKAQRTPIAVREEGTPFRSKEKPAYQTPTLDDKRRLDEISSTPTFKYSFLKSLDVCVGKPLCHPDALVFRENYRNKKEDLAKILYELYNGKLFGNNLEVPLVWNKKLSNTAGRCLNKKKFNKRMSVVELSDKVLTSADRLRCTLIHELCHAATWIFDGEGGHGAKWKEWARKANAVFPDLPKIGVCHQYDIEYKYTYKCTLCAAKSYYHSKSKKVENIRCSYCYGAIEIFLNKKDKDGNIMPTPVKEPTGFAKFVKEKYQQYKRPDMKHAEVMKLLSNEFAALKVAGNLK